MSVILSTGPGVRGAGRGGMCVGVRVCVAGGMHGREGMHGKGRRKACLQERRSLKRAIHILLKCILVMQIFGKLKCSFSM